MNNECNLSCIYCHTDPVPRSASRLDLGSIAAAAEVVAAACRENARPFVVVFHGGGEPALHRARLEQALLRLRPIAAGYDLETFLYIATNGILSESDAVWLAHEFDLVGLSCDGPPEIHNRQRPRWDGSGSLHLVERTGRILREEGCRLHLRTTITRGGLAHQAGIARYICQRFSPEEIRFEPVYLGGRTGPPTGLETRHASEFVAGFLAARSVAREYGVPLTTSGTRPSSLHGPFCHLFRNVINLVPGSGDGRGAVATVCFKLTDAASVCQAGAAIGAMDPESGHFEIDELRLQRLRRRLDVKLAACDECFNFYHCARQCPDVCPLDTNPGQVPSNEPGFRCRVQMGLASAVLQETAARLWTEARRAGDGEPRGTAIL
jgi:pyruvate-formate lyase-activating enzyme